MTLAEIVDETQQLSAAEQRLLVQILLGQFPAEEGVTPVVRNAPDFLSLSGILNPEEDVDALIASYMEEKYL